MKDWIIKPLTQTKLKDILDREQSQSDYLQEYLSMPRNPNNLQEAIEEIEYMKRDLEPRGLIFALYGSCLSKRQEGKDIDLIVINTLLISEENAIELVNSWMISHKYVVNNIYEGHFGKSIQYIDPKDNVILDIQFRITEPRNKKPIYRASFPRDARSFY